MITRLNMHIIFIGAISATLNKGAKGSSMANWENDLRFINAMKPLLKHEGGYNDIAEDKGGATNYGISLRFYKVINPQATNEDIKNLTVEDAHAIYYNHFWDKPIQELLVPNLGMRVFFATVNMGRKQAYKILQRAIRAYGENITDDGILGKKTLSSLSRCDHDILLKCYRSELAGYYRSLVAKDSSQGKFLDGWLNRAYY